MVRWEYRTETQRIGDDKVDLDLLGNQSWELVAVVIIFDRMNPADKFEKFYFKRRDD